MFKKDKRDKKLKTEDAGNELHDTESKPESKQEEAKEKEDNWKEQFLRVNADFQNFKRRVEKEKSGWIKMAQISVIKAILPLVDELDMAIKSSEKYELSDELKSWLDGFKMMQKNLNAKLAELGVEKIDCSKKFDPNFHEALMQVSSPEHKSGEIVEVVSPGYTFGGEVIRHAKVNVAK